MSNNNEPPPAYDFVNNIKNLTENLSPETLDANIRQTRMLYNAMHIQMLNYTATSPKCSECGYCPKFKYENIKTYCEKQDIKYQSDNNNNSLIITKFYKEFDFSIHLNFEILKVNHCEKCCNWVGYYKFNTEKNTHTQIYYSLYFDDYVLTNDVKSMCKLFGQKFIDLNIFWFNMDSIYYNVAYQKGDNFLTDIVYMCPFNLHKDTFNLYNRKIKRPGDNETLESSIFTRYFIFVNSKKEKEKKNKIEKEKLLIEKNKRDKLEKERLEKERLEKERKEAKMRKRWSILRK